VRWKGTPLKQLHLPRGEWSYTGDFEAMRAARDWRMTRTQFEALSDEDRAWMIAFTRTESRMQAWERAEQEREIKRMTGKGR